MSHKLIELDIGQGNVDSSMKKYCPAAVDRPLFVDSESQAHERADAIGQVLI